MLRHHSDSNSSSSSSSLWFGIFSSFQSTTLGTSSLLLVTTLGSYWLYRRLRNSGPISRLLCHLKSFRKNHLSQNSSDVKTLENNSKEKDDHIPKSTNNMEIIIDKNKMYHTLKNDGNNLFINNDFENAIKKYLKAFDFCDDNPNGKSVLYQNIASAYFRLKNFQKSIEYCEKSFSEDQNNIKIFHIIFKLLRSHIDNEKISEYCQRIISIPTQLAVPKLYQEILLEITKKECYISNENEKFSHLNISHSNFIILICEFITDPIHYIFQIKNFNDSNHSQMLDQSQDISLKKNIHSKKFQQIFKLIKSLKIDVAYKHSMDILNNSKDLHISQEQFLLNFVGTCQLAMLQFDDAKLCFTKALNLFIDEPKQRDFVCLMQIKLALCQNNQDIGSNIKKVYEKYPENIDANFKMLFFNINDSVATYPSYNFIKNIEKENYSTLMRINMILLDIQMNMMQEKISAIPEYLEYLKKEIQICDSYIFPYIGVKYINLIILTHQFTDASKFIPSILDDKRYFEQSNAYLLVEIAELLCGLYMMENAIILLNKAIISDKYFDIAYEKLFYLTINLPHEKKNLKKILLEFAKYCPYSPKLEECIHICAENKV